MADGLFLPDFCEIRAVFLVVLGGELLAFVLALSPVGGTADRWSDLALVSLFIQWVALSGAALLCACRPWLRLFDNARAGAISYGLLLAVTAGVSEIAWWLLRGRLVPLDVSPSLHLEFVLRSLGIAAVVGAVALRYLYVQFQWKANVESEARSRVQALQSRIRPHFLFNSMNTIASLTRTRPTVAERAVEDLADLFRMTLGDARVPSTLAREVGLCRGYLRIEGLRLGPRLRVAWDIDDLPDDARLPALSLQPLLENAIYHGIEPQSAGGVVRIEGRREGERLQLLISNPLPAVGVHRARPGNRLAQDNLRERLKMFFGRSATLEVEVAGDEYRVRLAFPYLCAPPFAGERADPAASEQP